jgi:hypothetical protein
MRGLVPRIHAFMSEGVDGRGVEMTASLPLILARP